MIFKHISGERQQPPPDSPTEHTLLALCENTESGWSRVDDDNVVAGKLVKHRRAPTPTASEEG